MNLRGLAPGFVYFISGVFASAGVNLFTAVPGASTSVLAACCLLSASIPWLTASWLLACVAQQLEDYRARMQRAELGHITGPELESIAEHEYGKRSSGIHKRVFLTAACVLLALLLFVIAALLIRSSQTAEADRAASHPAPGAQGSPVEGHPPEGTLSK